jgi:Hemerythrin HHE cation binding domain
MPAKTTRRSRPRSAGSSKRASARGRSSASRPRDVIALIKADHASVNRLFRRYKALSPRSLKSRRNVADRLVKDLAVHAGAEEQVLYPVARKSVPGGERLVEEALGEHRTLKEALAELDKRTPEDQSFDELVKEIEKEVRHHVKEEEGTGGILSQLRKHVPRDQLMRMAQLTRQAKQAVPTRPHPNAPDTPPGNAVVGVVTAMLDKAKDKLARRA